MTIWPLGHIAAQSRIGTSSLLCHSSFRYQEEWHFLCTGGWKLIIYSIKSEIKFRNGIKNSDFKFNLTKRRENSIT